MPDVYTSPSLSRRILLAGASALPASFQFLPLAAQAQPAPAGGRPPLRWSRSSARLLKPGVSRADFEKFLGTTVKKVYQSLIATGRMQGWSASRVILPAGEEAGWHYNTTLWFDQSPELEPAPGALAQALRGTDMNEGQFQARMAEMSTLVRVTVARPIAAAGTPEVGDYLRLDYMKVEPKNRSEYAAMERDWMRPVREEAIKTGPMKAWSAMGIVYPGGADRFADFYTMQAAKNSADLVRLPGGGSALFAKIHPNANYLAITNRSQELRTIAKSYVIRLLDRV